MTATAFPAENGIGWVRTNRLVGEALLASRPVPGRRETPLAPLVIVLAGLALGLVVPGAGGAGPAERASLLRHQQDTLAARSQAVLLDLYSLDARLAQARSRLSALRGRVQAVRDEQAQVAHELAIARSVWRSSVRTLDDRLLRLYEQGEPDSLSVVLGATSIDDAVTKLDALERSANLSKETIAQTRAAQRMLARVRRKLAARAAELQHLVAQVEATAASLASTRAQRVGYLESLEHQRRLNSAEIVRLAAAAKQIAIRSQTVDAASAPATPAAAPAGAMSGVRVLTVTATGYSLGGHTATGMPVGWGVVSVDPSVIPLGTRLSIPGYGDGVAADVGSGVQGAMIDLWFPTPAQALAWGRQTITITLH
jgi:peptidoglycan DL-endopeptidase CwlO